MENKAAEYFVFRNKLVGRTDTCFIMEFIVINRLGEQIECVELPSDEAAKRFPHKTHRFIDSVKYFELTTKS